MRIFLIMIIGIMLSNCSNSYVKSKKTITSPDDLMKFTNVWCEKQKQTNNTIKMILVPRTDSNRGPIDYKSVSVNNFPFIKVDTT